MGWLSTEVDFSRGGTAQPLVRFHVSVVVKPPLESTFEFPFSQGLERTEPQAVFESSPEPLDDGNGAVPADGPEALPGAEPSQRFAKSLGRELPPLIGDEVSRWAETKRGQLNQPAHLSGGGFFPEHFGGERHTREDIEYDYELEGKQSKEAGDRRDVSHPDVMGTASAESSG